VPKGRGRKGKAREVNIENHPYNDHVLPALRVGMGDLNFVKDNMAFRDLMDAPIHGWTHILHMLVYASEFCNYSEFDMNVVRWAILLHDAGHYSDDREESEHGKYSAYIFRKMCLKARTAGQSIPVDVGHVETIVHYHAHAAFISSSTEEAVVRACDRLDLWRIPGFTGLDRELMEAPGWSKVEKIAKRMRLEGKYEEFHEN
jgi:hypothetical protein